MGRKYIFYCDECGKEFLNDDIHLDFGQIICGIKYKNKDNKNWSSCPIKLEDQKNKQHCSAKCFFNWYSKIITKELEALKKYLGRSKFECNIFEYSRNNKWKEQMK